MVLIAGAVAGLLVSQASALAWTTPVAISNGADEAGGPRIAPSAAGGFHVAYRQKGAPWRIFYRHRAATGAWGPIETISNQVWADRPEIFEDVQGRPNILYTGHGAGDVNDLFHAGWTKNRRYLQMRDAADMKYYPGQ